MSGDVEKQRCWPLTGCGKEITYISARIHDNNEIPTATPMFLGSSNTYRQLGILSYACVCQTSKLVAINRKKREYYVYLSPYT